MPSFTRPPDLTEMIRALARRVLALERRDIPPYNRVKAIRTTNSSSITTGSSAAIGWTSEEWDLTSDGDNDQHDNVSNTTRLTCRKAAKYFIETNMNCAMNATFGGGVAIRKNGSSNLAWIYGTATTGWYVACEADLADGDYVEVVVTNNSGSSVVVDATTNVHPFFSMREI